MTYCCYAEFSSLRTFILTRTRLTTDWAVSLRMRHFFHIFRHRENAGFNRIRLLLARRYKIQYFGIAMYCDVTQVTVIQRKIRLYNGPLLTEGTAVMKSR